MASTLTVARTTTHPSFRVLVALGLVAAVFVAVPAMAGPPLQTDDPDTLAKGAFELNTAYTLSRSARDAAGSRLSEQEAPLFDLNYGLAEGVQIKFEIPLLLLVDPGGGASSHAGIGDASIGAKIRILSEEDSLFSVSIYPAVGVPFGNRKLGLGTGKPSLTLPVEIGHHFLDDKLFIYADAGYQEQFAKGEGDTVFTGVAVEYELVEGFTLCGEVRWEFGLRGAPDDSLFNVGVKWALSDYAAFIGSAGRSFDPDADSGAGLLLYLGVQWSF